MTAIGLAGTEVSSQQITRRLANLSRAFRAGLAALVNAADPVVSHQPLDAFVVHHLTLPTQLGSHPRRPIGTTGVGMDLFDDRDQFSLGSVRGSRPVRLPTDPPIEPLPGH